MLNKWTKHYNWRVQLFGFHVVFVNVLVAVAVVWEGQEEVPAENTVCKCRKRDKTHTDWRQKPGGKCYDGGNDGDAGSDGSRANRSFHAN